MHHPLGDPLPVKVCHLVQVHKVLQEDWAPGANCHGVELVVNWMTMAGCHDISTLGVDGKMQVGACLVGGVRADTMSLVLAARATVPTIVWTNSVLLNGCHERHSTHILTLTSLGMVSRRPKLSR